MLTQLLTQLLKRNYLNKSWECYYKLELLSIATNLCCLKEKKQPSNNQGDEKEQYL